MFVITGIIFAFTFWLSNQLANHKVQQLRDIEDQISLNILSTETRYSLLEKTSCDNISIGEGADIGLNGELTDLAHRVKFLESQISSDNENVLSVKKYYTLLQIKDYLLSRTFHDRCHKNIASILYFHQADCTDCVKQSIVLDQVASTYPQIRVYWLDKDIDTPALQTLLSLFKVKTGPTIVIRDKVYEGFQSLADIEKNVPEIVAFKKKAAKEALDKENAAKVKDTSVSPKVTTPDTTDPTAKTTSGETAKTQ